MISRSKISIEVSTITKGALMLALIYIFFFLFKGVTNIFNAFLVPITLYVFSKGKNRQEKLLIYGVLITFCALFYNIQVVFVTFYCAIAYLLNSLNNNKKLNKVFTIIILSTAISLSFWVAIILTDYIFLTRINAIMMQVLKNNIIAYGIIFFIEGAVIGLILLFLSNKFDRYQPYMDK